jgi:hypothetical protein
MAVKKEFWWGKSSLPQNSRKDLGAPPKPAAALPPVSAAGLGLPRPYSFCRDAAPLRLYKRRVRAASRFSATSGPSWRENQHYGNWCILEKVVK